MVSASLYIRLLCPCTADLACLLRCLRRRCAVLSCLSYGLVRRLIRTFFFFDAERPRFFRIDGILSNYFAYFAVLKASSFRMSSRITVILLRPLAVGNLVCISLNCALTFFLYSRRCFCRWSFGSVLVFVLNSRMRLLFRALSSATFVFRRSVYCLRARVIPLVLPPALPFFAVSASCFTASTILDRSGAAAAVPAAAPPALLLAPPPPGALTVMIGPAAAAGALAGALAGLRGAAGAFAGLAFLGLGGLGLGGTGTDTAEVDFTSLGCFFSGCASNLVDSSLWRRCGCGRFSGTG